MDPNQIPKGQSPEQTPGQARNPQGVYKHPGSGRELTVRTVPAADALVLQGFVYQGAEPKQPAKKAAVSTSQPELDAEKDELQKKLAAAEQRAEAEAKAREVAEKKASDETKAREAAEKSAEDAKKAAASNPSSAAATSTQGGNK